MTKSQPNILYIHTDQHRYDCVGANGHPLIKTPSLDRLAREGANFSHAFTPAAICTPARASLLTGTWPSTHRCIDIPTSEAHQPALRKLPVLWKLLSGAGYRQALVGRFHNEVTGEPTDYGVDDYVPDWLYGKWRAAEGIPPRPKANGCLGDVDVHITTDQSAVAWMADRTMELMGRYHAEKRPFFVRYDSVEPHLPCCPTAEFAEMYPPKDIPPWPSFPDSLEGRPYVQKRQRQMWGLDGWTWDRWQPMVGRYLGIISQTDRQIGRMLAKLEELGIADNTLVIYSTDHGDFCGGHGLIDKHFSMYDDIMRVPLMMRFPGRIKPGQACDAFVTNEIDVAKTILTAAGVEAPVSFEGQDLVQVLRGTLPGRDDIFAQYQGGETGLYSCRMLRNREWKYVWNPTSPEDELYHLPSDPGEVRNRIEEPELQEELQQLRLRLIAWMESIRDPLLNNFTRSLLDLSFPPIIRPGILSS